MYRYTDSDGDLQLRRTSSLGVSDRKDEDLRQRVPQNDKGRIDKGLDAASASSAESHSGQDVTQPTEESATGTPVDMGGVCRGDSERSSKTVCKSPLSWFGVLVPPALREAQANFLQGEQKLACRPNVLVQQPGTDTFMIYPTVFFQHWR